MNPRAYISDFTIHFNQATVKGALYPIRKPEENRFSYCTPSGGLVSKVFQDQEGKLWEQSDLKKYDKKKAEDEGEMEIIEPSALFKARESELPPNILNVTAHPRSDVDQYVFPGKTQAYIIKPIIKKGKKEIVDPVNTQWYDFLNVVVRDSDSALIGVCNLRGHEGLFRLGIYQGYLTIHKQQYPAELNQYDRYYPSMDGAVRDKAVEASRKVVQSFSAEDYVNKIARKLAELSGAEHANDEPVTSDNQREEIDMMAALESFGV